MPYDPVPSGTAVQLQSTLLPRRRQVTEVRTAAPALGTVLGHGTLPFLLHAPPHLQWSPSQRERAVYGVSVSLLTTEKALSIDQQ